MRQKDIIDAGIAHPSHFSVGTVCNALKLGGVSEIKNHGGRGILWQLSADDVVLKIED